MKIAPAPGTCRFCRCKGDECTLADGDKCGWVDDARTVCNSPPCLRAFDKWKRKQPAKSKQLVIYTGRKPKKVA